MTKLRGEGRTNLRRGVGADKVKQGGEDIVKKGGEDKVK